MKKQTNKHWQSLLLTTIATLLIFGLSSSAFAQKSLNAKYPKPDFSAMEEYWEVISYEYDFTGNGIPNFTIVVKRKDAKAPRVWDVSWRDGNGAEIVMYQIFLDNFNTSKVGEVVEKTIKAPFKSDMPRVRSTVVTEDPNY